MFALREADGGAVLETWMVDHGGRGLAGGLGVLAEPTRRAAGYWLIATLLAVFPGERDMAVNADRFRGIPEPPLWARLPLQGALIARVWRATLR